MNMDSLKRTVVFERGLYRNVAKFGYRILFRILSFLAVSANYRCFPFPQTFFFFPSFTSVCLALF